MSSNGETGVVLRGVTHGAVDFLIKPVRVEEAAERLAACSAQTQGSGEAVQDCMPYCKTSGELEPLAYAHASQHACLNPTGRSGFRSCNIKGLPIISDASAQAWEAARTDSFGLRSCRCPS